MQQPRQRPLVQHQKLAGMQYLQIQQASSSRGKAPAESNASMAEPVKTRSAQTPIRQDVGSMRILTAPFADLDGNASDRVASSFIRKAVR